MRLSGIGVVPPHIVGRASVMVLNVRWMASIVSVDSFPASLALKSFNVTDSPSHSTSHPLHRLHRCPTLGGSDDATFCTMLRAESLPHQAFTRTVKLSPMKGFRVLLRSM